MSVSGLNIQAIEQASGWWTEQSDNGCMAQRTFLFSFTEQYGNQDDELVDLPSVGMPFDDSEEAVAPWSRCWLREMRCEKYGIDEDKTLIVCTYSNAPWDRPSATTGDTPALDYTMQADGDYINEWLLKMDMDVSAELQDVGTDGNWIWDGSSPEEEVKQSIYLTTKSNSISCTRVVGRSPYDVATYMTLMQSLAGKICNGDDPENNPFNTDKHTLLFNGGTARPYTDHSGYKMWEIDLNFELKYVESTVDETGGWNLIPRVKANSALYDEPLDGSSNPLYAEDDLRKLFKYK